jgi:hypothetical protein
VIPPTTNRQEVMMPDPLHRNEKPALTSAWALAFRDITLNVSKISPVACVMHIRRQQPNKCPAKKGTL